MSGYHINFSPSAEGNFPKEKIKVVENVYRKGRKMGT